MLIFTRVDRAPRLFVATDVTVLTDGLSNHFSTHGSLCDEALERYSATREGFTLVARTSRITSDDRHIRLTPYGLTLHGLVDDDREARLPRRLLNLARQLTRVPIRPGDLVVVRLPEMISALLWLLATFKRARVVANVVADVDAVIERFHLPPKPARTVLVAFVAWMVRHSTATVYVTQRTLQQTYPPKAGAPTFSASNVLLHRDTSFKTPRIYCLRDGSPSLRLVAVGSQDSLVKGHDVLIRALAALRVVNGFPAHLALVGGGRCQPELIKLAHDLNVTDYVSFHGHINDRNALAEILDAADIFVMPSRTEGLPRAMIEAMARGMCCIGSRVGGIPELAPEEALFEPNSHTSVTDCLLRLIHDPSLATRIAKQEHSAALEIMEYSQPAVVASFLRKLANL